MRTLRRVLLDALALTPYWRGKGKLVLALLTGVQPGSPIAVRMPYHCRIRIGADPIRQTLLPYWIGQYEAQVSDLYRSVLAHLTTAESVIDIGANLGFYTVLGAGAQREMGSGSVFSFEPNPTAFLELVQNVKLNQFKNVELNQVALAAQSGETALYLNPDGITLASLAPDASARSDSIDVNVTSLDEHPASRDRIGLIKLDVEGAELLVLRGAQKLIARDQPFILYEEFDAGYNRFGYSQREVRCFLQELKYRLYAIGATRAGRARLAPITPQSTPSADHYGNIFAVPHTRKWLK